MSIKIEETLHEYEVIKVCITKRALNELKRVSERTGRSVENLAEAAIEDECIQSERT